MAIERDTLTSQPPEHDYVLSPTGFSWNVRRSNGRGAFFCIVDGTRHRLEALAKVLALAETDRTDAWETVGTGVFWRLGRFRPVRD